MDQWEEMAKSMEGMSEEDRNQLYKKTEVMCRCPPCPSMDKCAKDKGEIAYCMYGKSECSLTMKGCLCPTCPVKELFGLKYSYYCMLGDEKVMRGSLTSLK